MNTIGIISAAFLWIVNILHLLCTTELTIEQIKTGWGYGTNIDLGVLYIWLIEIICLPALIFSLVFLIISKFKKTVKALSITNVILFSLAILQIGLTNLFLYC